MNMTHTRQYWFCQERFSGGDKHKSGMGIVNLHAPTEGRLRVNRQFIGIHENDGLECCLGLGIYVFLGDEMDLVANILDTVV